MPVSIEIRLDHGRPLQHLMESVDNGGEPGPIVGVLSTMDRAKREITSGEPEPIDDLRSRGRFLAVVQRSVKHDVARFHNRALKMFETFPAEIVDSVVRGTAENVAD